MLGVMRQIRVSALLLAGAAYILIGMGTAVLAGATSSSAAVKGWRAAAWVLGLATFAIHFIVARGRHLTHSVVALQLGVAVAVGALGLAALGPLRSHWHDPSRFKLALLSVVAWPLLTGVPAFVTALLAGVLLDRAKRARVSPRVD
jgi:hypothetical protein